MKDRRPPVPHFLRVVRAIANVRSTLPIAAAVTTVVTGLSVSCADSGVAKCYGRCGEPATGAGGSGAGGLGAGGSGGMQGIVAMPDAGDGGHQVGVIIMPDGGDAG